MAVRIRLTRVGATKRPAYRVIAIDRRRSRDGRALEILGFYDPLTEPATVQLETEKISAWIGRGAQPSDTVVRLMRQAEKAAADPSPAEKPKRAARPRTAAAKPSTKAAKQAAPQETPSAGGAAESQNPESEITEPAPTNGAATEAAEGNDPAETPQTVESADEKPDERDA